MVRILTWLLHENSSSLFRVNNKYNWGLQSLIPSIIIGIKIVGIKYIVKQHIIL